jgi:hypothetical protein
MSTRDRTNSLRDLAFTIAKRFQAVRANGEATADVLAHHFDLLTRHANLSDGGGHHDGNATAGRRAGAGSRRRIEHKTTKDRSMIFSTQQVARVTSVVNDLGDYFSQDRNTDAMHRCLAVIRQELVEETDPITHPEIIEQLNWIDRVLDRIEARRMATVQNVATRLRETASHYLN